MTQVANTACGNKGQMWSPGVDLNRPELTKGIVSIEMSSVTQVASVSLQKHWLCCNVEPHVESRGGLK